MITKHTWQEFQTSGMLWLINRSLHLFGWAIVFLTDEQTGEILEVYPARVSFRGFTPELDGAGFQAVTKYMADTAVELLSDTQ